MASLNKATIIGHLGRDPELRYFTDGTPVANISVATSEKWKDKQTGEDREATEWHRVVLTGRLAEVAAQYLRKGSLAYFEGKLRTRKWQDKEGKDNYTTEIAALNMVMLDGRSERSDPPEERPTVARNAQAQQQARQGNAYAAAKAGDRPKPPAATGTGFDDMDDDIPFILNTLDYSVVPSKQRRLRHCR